MLDLKQQEIIDRLLDIGVAVELTKKGYKINGFYKSGEVELIPEEDYFVAHSRYNETEDIYNFDDLVELNYYWWQRYKDSYDGWKQPEPNWIPDMERLGLIQKKTITYYE